MGLMGFMGLIGFMGLMGLIGLIGLIGQALIAPLPFPLILPFLQGSLQILHVGVHVFIV